MQKRSLKILVACASGVATSTLAAAVVQEVLDSVAVKADIAKGTVLDIPTRAEDMDLILTTGRYREPCAAAMMNITAFITGINEDDAKKQLAALVKDLAEKVS